MIAKKDLDQLDGRCPLGPGTVTGVTSLLAIDPHKPRPRRTQEARANARVVTPEKLKDAVAAFTVALA